MFRFLCIFLFVAGIYVSENGVQSVPAFEIDQFNHRIVGGYEVSTKDYIYFGIIRYRYGILIISCGASIITPKTAMTAAHCIDFVPLIGTTLGATLTYGMSSYSANDGTKVNIIATKQHPQFDSSTLDYDIALVYLQYKVTIPSFAQLPIQNEQLPIPSTLVRVIGFGVLSEGGASNDKLNAVDVPLVAQSTCEENYGAGQITENMFCAGEEGKDSCQGDSGAPVILSNGTVVGIVSWGEGCARKDRPGVYTTVAKHIAWINANCSP